MYRLSRDQTLDQILAKLNIYRQSYSDLKVDNLGAFRHIGVGRSRFSQFGTLPPRTNKAPACQISTQLADVRLSY